MSSLCSPRYWGVALAKTDKGLYLHIFPKWETDKLGGGRGFGEEEQRRNSRDLGVCDFK